MTNVGCCCARSACSVSSGCDFTIKDGKIVECDFLVDPERLARLDLRVLER